MDLLELFYSLEPRAALAGAMVVSILLYTITANISWAGIAPRGDRFSRLVGWARRFRLRVAVIEIVRWIYYLGLPYAVLMFGYAPVRALGLWNLDWLMNWWIGLIVLLGGGAILVWVWKPYTESEHPEAVDLTGWGGSRQILEALFQEAHWAFYRSGPIFWTGDFYWGSFIGLALALIEGWSNPFVRANIRDITRADAPLWAGSLAIVSVLIFNYTQNTWYCLIAHLILVFGLRPWIGLGVYRGSFHRRDSTDETTYEE